MATLFLFVPVSVSATRLGRGVRIRRDAARVAAMPVPAMPWAFFV